MNPQNDNPLPFPDLDPVYVEGGTFTMGDEKGDLREACQPTHKVTVSSFYMCKYQVTQRLWQTVMGNNPSHFKGDPKGASIRPVETVSWLDVQDFIKELNGKKEVRDYLAILDPPVHPRGFRLPTEAEWEFAARGGIYSQGYDYCGSDKLKQVGYYSENSNKETHDVGLLLANELGLYNMSGNVWEWCEDDYYEDYHNAPKDGSAWINFPNRLENRVLRGGCFYDLEVNCRPVFRYGTSPSARENGIGFRLALSLQSVG